MFQVKNLLLFYVYYCCSYYYFVHYYSVVMLDVLNVSTGQNTATSDKFPKRILTEAYDAGFTNSLLFKDVKLYQEAVIAGSHPNLVGKAVVNSLGQFTEAEPGSDFTRIYPFVKGGKLKEG